MYWFAIARWFPKGQLISKWLFGILNSPKKRTKKFDFTTKGLLISKYLFGRTEDTKKTFRNYLTFMIPQNDLVFFSFFGRNWRYIPKRHFEINWPLFCTNFLSLTSSINKRATVLSTMLAKGQLISKPNCQAEDSSKKRTNEFVFTSMRRVFVRFFEESSARKKRFEIIWPLVVHATKGQ